MVRAVYAAPQDLSNIYLPAQKLGGQSATIGAFISPIIQNILIVSGMLCFGAILIAGFNYITGNGDKAKVEQATNMLNYAIVGLVLIAAAFVITQLIGKIGGFDFTNPGI